MGVCPHRDEKKDRGRQSVFTGRLQGYATDARECVKFSLLTSQVAVYNSCHFCGNVGRSQLVEALQLERPHVAVSLLGFVHH